MMHVNAMNCILLLVSDFVRVRDFPRISEQFARSRPANWTNLSVGKVNHDGVGRDGPAIQVID
jgi:hypothetical protein